MFPKGERVSSNVTNPAGQGSAAGGLMRAAVLYARERMEIREVPAPRLAAHEVLVRVKAVGVCGTDLHIFAGHANYTRDATGRPIPLEVEPQILGHEIAGVVEDVGSDVRDIHAGQRVVLDQGRTCMGERRAPPCEYCETGDSHQCEFYREHGITGLPGGFAELIAVPARNVVFTDAGVDLTAAALTEPLGCILHSCDMLRKAGGRYTLSDPRPDARVRTVFIAGAGIAGLLFIQYLRNVLGFEGSLLVSEPSPPKRALAERFGARSLDPARDGLLEAVAEASAGRGVELFIDASGAGSVFELIPRLIRKQATVLLYGHGHHGVDLSILNNVQFREPTLVAPAGASGGFEADGRPRTYTEALRLIERSRIEVQRLITHRYETLEAIPTAFEQDERSPDYIKGVVTL